MPSSAPAVSRVTAGSFATEVRAPNSRGTVTSWQQGMWYFCNTFGVSEVSKVGRFTASCWIGVSSLQQVALSVTVTYRIIWKMATDNITVVLRLLKHNIYCIENARHTRCCGNLAGFLWDSTSSAPTKMRTQAVWRGPPGGSADMYTQKYTD